MNINKKVTVLAAVLLVTAVVMSLISIKNNTVNIKIPDYYSFSAFDFDGDFGEFRRDTYNWYKSIENNDDVYIINTAFYDDEILESWKENKIYNFVPDKEFWYFTASPSYLKQMGINVEVEYINEAMDGVRLYMIPDTLSPSEMDVMSDYLKEDALYQAKDSSIETEFTKNEKIKIITYTPNGDYFTWPSDKGCSITDKAPVIYVCTSQNMKYFENESLNATGVDSYIKFADDKALKKYFNSSLLNRYHLDLKKSSEIYANAAKSKLVDSKVKKVFN